jgi:hypothetical protein
MFWLCKRAIPHMQSGASIINTSSSRRRIRPRSCWTTPPPRRELSTSPKGCPECSLIKASG